MERFIARPMSPALCVLIFSCVVCVRAVQADAPAAQGNEGRIWDGVYTTAQAERGKTAYDNRCGRCHGVDLKGSTAPALTGDPFMMNWEGETLNRLFSKIRDTMPANEPASVDTETKLDIVAYLLNTNAFPAGATEVFTTKTDALARARQLDEIQILRKGQTGSGVPNFTLVQVAGCLTRGSGNVWLLTNSTEPVRARSEQPEAAPALDTRPVGRGSFRLVSVTPFSPDAHIGRTVEARGLLYRAPDENLLRVVSLQTLAPSCGN